MNVKNKSKKMQNFNLVPTSCNKFLLYKVIVPQLIKQLLLFMQPPNLTLRIASSSTSLHTDTLTSILILFFVV